MIFVLSAWMRDEIRRTWFSVLKSIEQKEKKRRTAKSRLKGGFFSGVRGSPQAEKLDPQPQVLVALGFLMTNWAPSRSSL